MVQNLYESAYPLQLLLRVLIEDNMVVSANDTTCKIIFTVTTDQYNNKINYFCS